MHDDIYVPATTQYVAQEQWNGGYTNVTNFQTQSLPYPKAWSFAMVPQLLCLPLEEL